MRISDWSSDVCSSDLPLDRFLRRIFGVELQEGCAVVHLRNTGGLRKNIIGQARAVQRRHERTARCRRAPEILLESRLALRNANAALDIVEEPAKIVFGVAHHGPHSRSEEHTSELQSLKRTSNAVSV